MSVEEPRSQSYVLAKRGDSLPPSMSALGRKRTYATVSYRPKADIAYRHSSVDLDRLRKREPRVREAHLAQETNPTGVQIERGIGKSPVMLSYRPHRDAAY